MKLHSGLQWRCNFTRKPRKAPLWPIWNQQVVMPSLRQLSNKYRNKDKLQTGANRAKLVRRGCKGKHLRLIKLSFILAKELFKKIKYHVSYYDNLFWYNVKDFKGLTEQVSPSLMRLFAFLLGGRGKANWPLRILNYQNATLEKCRALHSYHKNREMPPLFSLTLSPLSPLFLTLSPLSLIRTILISVLQCYSRMAH